MDNKRTWKEEFKSSSNFDELIKLFINQHLIIIRIRKDSKWYEIDGDWLNTLVRQEFLGE